MEVQECFNIINPRAVRRNLDKQILCSDIIRALNHNTFSISEEDLEVGISDGGAGSAADLFSYAQSKGFSVVNIFGGDGTINQSLQNVRRFPCHQQVGLVPCGTANDLSFSCGIKNYWQALRVIFGSERNEKRIDLGKINDRIFVNALSFGLDARIASLANQARDRIEPLEYILPERVKIQILLYFLSFFREIGGRMVYPEIDIRIDREVLCGFPTSLLVISNGHRYGRYFSICPEAELDDGFLDVCLVGKISKKEILWNIRKFVKGKHVNLPMVHMYKAQEVEILGSQPLAVETDGEVLQAKTHYSVKVLPQSLSVVVPSEEFCLEKESIALPQKFFRIRPA